MTERERKVAYAWDHIKQAGSAFAKRGDALLPGYRELKRMRVVTINGPHVQLAGDYRRAFLAGEGLPSWADLSVAVPTARRHHAKKKSSRSKAATLAPLGPPRSRVAAAIVYRRPSGYWYAQARDPATGAQITDASGYSRENVLRELQGKFAMIGVTIKSIADEDPYVAGHSSQQHHAAKKSSAQLEREINEALSRTGRGKTETAALRAAQARKPGAKLTVRYAK